LRSAGPSVFDGFVQLREREGRRRLADQRRGHFARIAPQADQQERAEHDEDAERDQQLLAHRPRPRVAPRRRRQRSPLAVSAMR
jgi:hypothetical protein